MKNVFKSALPVMAFILATGGAFAFKTAPSEKAVTQFLGHKKQGQSCSATNVMCQDINNGVPCTSGTDVLYKLNGSSCPDQLWKIP